MITVAITGTMGSGKSTVVSYLKKQFVTIETDKITHDLLQIGCEGYLLALSLFGKDILFENNELNKKKVAEIIFNNQTLKKEYESKMHTLVYDKVVHAIKENKNEELIFIEVPLLFESNWEEHFDYSILISTNHSLLKERLIKNRGYSKEEVEKRIRWQMCEEEKIERSDFVIYNNEEITDLFNAVDSTINQIRSQ